MRRIPFFALIALVACGAAWAATRFAYDNNYAKDRAEIEDLQSRYLFALDG